VVDYSQLTRKVLALNVLISQGIVLLIGLAAALGLGYQRGDLRWLHLRGADFRAWLWLLPALAVLTLVQLVFCRWVPARFYYDQINEILMQRFALPELALLFALGAFSEELLFRGIAQSLWGLLIAGVLFAAFHTRYWRKPPLLLETLIFGLILGYLYLRSGSLAVCITAHTLLNLTSAWLMKTVRISITSS
jgi:membrane protease YdiL (CAAX protease family)